MGTQGSLRLSRGGSTSTSVAPHLTLHTCHYKLHHWPRQTSRPVFILFSVSSDTLIRGYSPPVQTQLKDVSSHLRMELSVYERPHHSSGLCTAGCRVPGCKKGSLVPFCTQGATDPQRLLAAEAGSEVSRMPSFTQLGSLSHPTVLQSAGSGLLGSSCPSVS